ncbi:MAG: YafY family protein [Bacteroidota bacterium]|nr:YafY family protein [Bacteroidota bacterium]
MRIDRMLGIVVLLLNRNKVSAKELSRRFEVSVRTIYRDIEAINLAGIPIISFPGSKGGLGIMENYRLNGQVLSIDDMSSIISTLKNVNKTLGNSDLETVSEKILNLIPKDKIDYVNKQAEELCIDLIPWTFKEKNKDYLKLIQFAISEKMIIRFFYRNNRGEGMHRTVEPMTLVFKGYAWYLFGFCRDRKDFRIFKLSRMNIIEIMPEKFERRKGSYQEFMESSMKAPNAKSPNMIDTVLKFSPQIRLKVDEYFEESIVRVLDDGSIIVAMKIPEDEWVFSTILSFGEFVEVIKPDFLKKIIQERIKKMNSIYNADILLSQP